MNKKQIVTSLIFEEIHHADIASICTIYHISEEVLSEWLALGIFESILTIEELQLDAKKIARLQSASRLLHDLNLNAHGVVLALELLDEIDALRQKLTILERLREQE